VQEGLKQRAERKSRLLLDAFGPPFCPLFSLTWPTLIHQVPMYAPQIAHQGGCNHYHAQARLPTYWYFTISKGVFDGSHCGFLSSTKILTTGTRLCTPLAPQS